MNGDKKTIADIAKNLSEPGLDANTEVVIGCPAIYLEYARSVLPASFGVAAQNCYKVREGSEIILVEIKPRILPPSRWPRAHSPVKSHQP